MKQILTVFTLMFFTQLSFAQKAFITEYQQKWANVKESTLQLAKDMPEEYYGFKPAKEMQSFKEQLLHITSNMAWLSSSYLGGEKLEADLKKTDYSKEEIIEILTKGFDLAAAAVENFPLEELKTEVKFFAGPMTKRQIFVLMNDHAVHHRGQIIVYARMKGVKPPRYKGW